MGGTFVLLLAAGSGTRLGGPAKAFMELGGIPMFLHSYRTMVAWGDLRGVIILAPDGLSDIPRRWIDLDGAPVPTEVRVGGETRQVSVRRGLDALPSAVDVVVCHDAARPFASANLFRRVRSALADPDIHGAIPTVPSPDTVKRVRGGLVVETFPRHELGLVQTPQGFRRAALEDAHERADRSGLAATDDAMLLEAAGYSVGAVEGEMGNFKITTQEDLRRAEEVLAHAGRGDGSGKTG